MFVCVCVCVNVCAYVCVISHSLIWPRCSALLATPPFSYRVFKDRLFAAFLFRSILARCASEIELDSPVLNPPTPKNL